VDRFLVTSQFHFHIPSVEVSQEHIFNFQSNEGERAVTSMVIWNLVRCLMEK
jgi:hypothetical protein